MVWKNHNSKNHSICARHVDKLTHYKLCTGKVGLRRTPCLLHYIRLWIVSTMSGCLSQFAAQLSTLYANKLIPKPLDLGLGIAICIWLLDFPTNRPNLVRIGHRFLHPDSQHWCPSGLCAQFLFSAPCTSTTPAWSLSLPMTPLLSPKIDTKCSTGQQHL